MKRCTLCEETKDAAEFYKHRFTSDGLQSRCKVCMRAYTLAWEQNNRERRVENQRLYRVKHTERRREYFKDLRQKSPEPGRRYAAERKARKLAATIIKFTDDQLADRWAYYGNKCWICGGAATATDHVKPLAKGGAHALCNLRPICKPCNSSKGSRWPFDKSELLNRAA